MVPNKTKIFYKEDSFYVQQCSISLKILIKWVSMFDEMADLNLTRNLWNILKNNKKKTYTGG